MLQLSLVEIEFFLRIVRDACDQFDGSVTSYHRTAKRNAAVGGAPNSAHRGWCGADIVLDDWTLKEQCMHFLKSEGLRVIDEVATKNHLHVDDRIPPI